MKVHHSCVLASSAAQPSACLESDSRHAGARRWQARCLRPAVRSWVVDLHRAETPTGVAPAKDAELAAHHCGGVKPPSGAHAC
eukprot:scaffold70712_cov61-Phaeocystis_antarctica.AAC.2